MPDQAQVLYLLHFSPPFGRARHYLGITNDDTIARRLDDHRRGKGAALTRQALAAGSTLTLARLWHGANRQLEKKVKWAGHFNLACPLCLHRLPTPECRAYPPFAQRFESPAAYKLINF